MFSALRPELKSALFLRTFFAYPAREERTGVATALVQSTCTQALTLSKQGFVSRGRLRLPHVGAKGAAAERVCPDLK